MVVELGELLGPVLIYPEHIDSLTAEQQAERLTVRAAGDAFSVLAGTIAHLGSPLRQIS